VRLGFERAWTVEAALLAVVVGAALVTLGLADAPRGALAVAVGAGVAVLIGLAVGRRGGSARLERSWQLQAVGVGLLGAAWIAGMELAARPGQLFGG
jgi:hypothetical protein